MADQQPFQFDYLIDTSIKRLTRPKFRNDFEQYYDNDNFKQSKVQVDVLNDNRASEGRGSLFRNSLFGTEVDEVRDPEQLANLMNMCDVGYDGISSHSIINFNPSFGKISMGEHFKVLFTIQNKISTFAVEELRIKATLNSVPKPKGGKEAQAPDKGNE
jgi:hypothetical protein